MKKAFIVALIGLTAISCSKGDSVGPEGQDGLITFMADAPGTRSSFPGTSGLMHWSSYDNLGVYAFKGSTFNTAIVSDLCVINNESVGTNEGKFTPKNFLKASSWFGSNASASDTYSFYAYYPESRAAATYDSGTVLLNIPAAQTGEFGRHQICSSEAVTMAYADVQKEKYVRFAFKPVSSLIRIRLVLTDDSSVDEVYIKQLSLTANNATLCGNCTLTFPHELTAAATSTGNTHSVNVSLSTPVKITKNADGNPYIDAVILPTSAGVSGNISFAAYTNTNTRLTIKDKELPTDGFKAGTRYFLDREISVVIDDESSPDAYYVDGGSAWDGEVENDGAYTDGGTAW